MKKTIFGFVALVSFFACDPAKASTVVWDFSPGIPGVRVLGNNWVNEIPGGHYADKVTFNFDTIIDGIAVYGARNFNEIGDPVLITIWQDADGIPDSVIQQYHSTISEIDLEGATDFNKRNYASFDDFIMFANTPYWIGMGGADGHRMVQSGVLGAPGGDNRMAVWSSDNTFYRVMNETMGDMAFRLYGEAGAPVPEPATMILFGTGLACLVGIIRKKNKA